jgi:uncharacterized phage protein (TIGR02220 family)
MSKNKDPAVLFYTSDFLSGVMGLTMEERGQYITLLCLQHQQGPLTEKQIRLSVGEISEDLRSKFSIDKDGRLYNERMADESEKRRAFIESRRRSSHARFTRNPIDTSYDTSYDNRTEHRAENENININVIKDIIDYLNTKLGTKYKYNSDYILRHINARLGEGFVLQDFQTVIDRKVQAWRGTEMAKFLRPETLFGTKFQSYLNELQADEPGEETPRYAEYNPAEALERAISRSYQ